MRLKSLPVWICGLACLMAPAFALAYTPQSLADFAAGRSYQATQQWLLAVRAYQAALRDDPSLYQANKALGTVYYMAGDRRGALYYYDLYLTTTPGDLATKNFADQLRASLNSPAPNAVAAVATPVAVQHSRPFQPGFDLRVPVQFVFAGAADVDEFYADDNAFYHEPKASLAWGAGLGVDYGLANGFVAGLDILYGPNRTNSETTSYPDEFGGNDTESDTFAISQYAVLLTPGWRFKLGKAFIVEPRLGLGIMGASMKVTYADTVSVAGAANGETGGSASASSTGMGIGVWPELRAEYELGNVGLGLSLGYVYNTDPQKYTAGTPNYSSTQNFVGSEVQYYNASGNLTNWSVTTSGLTCGLFAVYHFQPLLW